MPVRIADENGSSTQGTIAAGIRWAADHGARVINLSWGLAVGGALDRPGGARDRGGRRPRRDGHARGDERRLPRPEPQPLGEPKPGRRSCRRGRRRRAAAALVEPRHLGRHRRARIGDVERGAASRRRRRGRPRRAPGAHRAPGASGAAPRVHAGSRARRRLALPARRRRRGRRPPRSPVPVYRLAVSKAGRGAGVVGGSGAAIQCGEFCADRLDAGTVVTLTAAPMRGSRFRRLARRVPRDEAVLRRPHRRADGGRSRLRQAVVSSSPCRAWSYSGEAPRGSTSAARCAASTRTCRSRLVEPCARGRGVLATSPACRPRRCCAHPSCVRRPRAHREPPRGPLDLDGIYGWRDWVTSDWDDADQLEWLDSQRVEFVRGAGRVVRPGIVEAAADLEYDRLVVATGSSPFPRPRARGSSRGTTADATSAHEVPASLIVLGGGVAGCELAQLYRRLGADVTIVLRVRPVGSRASTRRPRRFSRDAFEEEGIVLRLRRGGRAPRRARTLEAERRAPRDRPHGRTPRG